MIASVGEDGGWLRLWDEALNLGERHTKGLKLVKGAESSWAWIKAMSFVRLDSRRGNCFRTHNFEAW